MLAPADARTGQLTVAFRLHETVDAAALIDNLRGAPNVVVIIPVYNGGEMVRECLRSIVAHTRDRRIVVIDDHSSDAATVAILAEFAASGRIEVVTNPANLGYTRTANLAADLAGADDFVLINSDTVVGPLWLERLRWTAYSVPHAATVSAFSDNAGAFAVPLRGVANPWPTDLGWASVARFVAQRADAWALETATAHGFCMYVRRAAFAAVGRFDEVSFPRGYGEENEWSMRAIGAGFVTLGAPHVFVKHQQGGSFGTERDALVASARTTIDRLHPSYTALVSQMLSSPEYARVGANSARILDEVRVTDPVPRTLYVLHRSGGGTPETNADLMDGLAHVQDAYLLTATAAGVTLLEWKGGVALPIRSWTADPPFVLTDSWRPDYARLIAEVIATYAIELVHVRHLINQPLTTVPEVCRLMGVPMILSTHDFYYICPSVHLLDQDQRFCGGTCTPGEGPCTLPTPFVRGAPDLKHRWIEEWKRRADTVLDASVHVIATTRSAAAIYRTNYPRHQDKLQLIEHGRDVTQGWQRLRTERDRRPGPLRVACPANWAIHKGTEYLATIVDETRGLVEWHLLGADGEFLGDRAVNHGRYKRDQFRDLLDQIDPDFVGLFSIWPETYSHTLTEAWALGIPVVATDIGAWADRIRDFGGGRLFDIDDPASVARYLLERARELAHGDLQREAVPRSSIRSKLSMAGDYELLYARTRELVHKPVVGYVVHGVGGSHPGSVHVRLLRRIRSTAADRVHFRALSAVDFVGGKDMTAYDAIVVQRDALDPSIVEEFIALARERSIPYFVELDDDLVTDEAIERLTDHGYEDHALLEMRTLIAGAAGISVSTPELAERFADIQDRILVVPNELDERLWTSPVVPAPVRPRTDGALRVLYMGSATHAEDLEILRGVFASLSASDGRPIRLELVGVTATNADWFDRLAVPTGMDQYGRFVAWLRSNAARWSLAVAPLVDTSFSAAKSDLKFLEYTMIGLPTVASNVGPYVDIGTHGGVVVANTTDDWRAAIVAAIDHPERSRELLERATGYVSGSRMLARGGGTKAWLDLILGTS